MKNKGYHDHYRFIDTVHKGYNHLLNFDNAKKQLEKGSKPSSHFGVLVNGVAYQNQNDHKIVLKYINKFKTLLSKTHVYHLSKSVNKKIVKQMHNYSTDLDDYDEIENSEEFKIFMRDKKRELYESVGLISLPYENTALTGIYEPGVVPALGKGFTPGSGMQITILTLFEEDESSELGMNVYKLCYQMGVNSYTNEYEGEYGIIIENKIDRLIKCSSYEYAYYLFNKLYKSTAVGIDTINRTIKLKDKLGTKYCKVHPVNYVLLKEDDRVIEGISKNTIKWSNSWLCPGHWRGLFKKDPETGEKLFPIVRDMTKIGKDRKGNYVERGRTWVIPHPKGEGPLVRKQRIIVDGGEDHEKAS